MVVVDFENYGDGFKPRDRSWRFNPVSSIPLSELKNPKIIDKKKRSGGKTSDGRRQSFTGLNDDDLEQLRRKSSAAGTVTKSTASALQRLPTNSDLGNRRKSIKPLLRSKSGLNRQRPSGDERFKLPLFHCDDQPQVTKFKKVIDNTEELVKFWCKYVDQTTDGKTTYATYAEFQEAILLSPFNVIPDVDLCKCFDKYGAGSVTLGDIHEEAGNLIFEFRRFMARFFSNAKDFLEQVWKLGDGAILDEERFITLLFDMGWTGGFERLLFRAMNTDGDGILKHNQLKWIACERARYDKRNEALRFAQMMKKRRRNEDLKSFMVLDELKARFQRKWGTNMIKVWRALDRDGNMSLTERELHVACTQLGMSEGIKQVWKVLGGNSKTVTLEEIDLLAAKQLAEFRRFCNKYSRDEGVIGAIMLMIDDFSGTFRVPADFIQETFLSAGYRGDIEYVLNGLCVVGERHLTEFDLEFLDHWKPSVFLTAKPSQEAKSTFKELLLAEYKTHLQAWKRLLDPDSDGRVSWREFESACKELGMQEEAASAFLAFDADFSGFITLEELDQHAYEIVCRFQNWAVKEFGSVYLAFKSMDADGNKQLSFQEFVHAARDYGFPAQYCRTLFDSLRKPGVRFLQTEDIDFLDMWESKVAMDKRLKMLQSISALRGEDSDSDEGLLQRYRRKRGQHGISYETDTPGPAFYTPMRKFGWGEPPETKIGEALEIANPLLKVGPAYTMGAKFPEKQMDYDDITPGPGHYQPIFLDFDSDWPSFSMQERPCAWPLYEWNYGDDLEEDSDSSSSYESSEALDVAFDFGGGSEASDVVEESLVQILSRQIAEKETQFQKARKSHSVPEMKELKEECKELKLQWRGSVGKEIEKKKQQQAQKKMEGDRNAARVLRRDRKSLNYQLHLHDKEVAYASIKKAGSAYEIQEARTEVKLLQKKVCLKEKEQELIDKRKDGADDIAITEIKDQLKDLKARVRVLKAELSDESEETDESLSDESRGFFSSDSSDNSPTARKRRRRRRKRNQLLTGGHRRLSMDMYDDLQDDEARNSIFGAGGRRISQELQPVKFVSRLSTMNLEEHLAAMDADSDDDQQREQQHVRQREEWAPLWEPKERVEFEGTPGPGSYHVEKGVISGRQRSPAYTMRSRKDQKVHPRYNWNIRPRSVKFVSHNEHKKVI